MTATVIKFPSTSPASVIDDAAKAGLSGVAVVGIDANGDTYMDVAGLDCATLVYLLERLKARVIG